MKRPMRWFLVLLASAAAWYIVTLARVFLLPTILEVANPFEATLVTGVLLHPIWVGLPAFLVFLGVFVGLHWQFIGNSRSLRCLNCNHELRDLAEPCCPYCGETI